MKKQKKNKKSKTPLLKTKVRPDKSVEIEIKKTPDKTVVGRILIYLIVFGMTALMLVGLIVLIVQHWDKLIG